MKPLCKRLFNHLKMQHIDSCADEKNIYIEFENKYFKFNIEEVTYDEYNKARNSNLSAEELYPNLEDAAPEMLDLLIRLSECIEDEDGEISRTIAKAKGEV